MLSRIHNVLILTAGSTRYPVQGLLDRAIQAVLAMKKNPILVLGSDGDEILSDCTLIEHCDLVFDLKDEAQPLAGLGAGLHATKGGVFALPLKEVLQAETLNGSVWRVLENTHATSSSEKFDLVRFGARGTTQAFPVLVTAHGVKRLKEIDGIVDWENPDLIITHWVINPSEIHVETAEKAA